MTVCLLTTPVTAAMTISNQDATPQTNNTLSKNETSVQSAEDVSPSSIILSQNVSITSDSESTYVPGKSYPFLIKNTIESPRILEAWAEKFSVNDAKIKIEIQSQNGETPVLTGVSSPESSYNHTDTEISTKQYTLNAENLRAGSTNFVMTQVKIPEGAKEFNISVTASTDSLIGVSYTDSKSFNIKKIDSYQKRLAGLAEARADTASSMSSQYDSIFNKTSVDEIVDRGMQNTFIETARFTKDIADLRKGYGTVGEQFAKYAKSQTTEKKFDGPWVGPIIQVQNNMYKNGFQQAGNNDIKYAGASNFALQKVARLAHAESAAWENGNKDRALTLLKKQRDLLSPRDYGEDIDGPNSVPDEVTDDVSDRWESNFNLYIEAQNQKIEAGYDNTLGPDTSEGTIAYFTGLKDFSLSQVNTINELAIPLAKPPNPGVELLNKQTVRDQLATGKPVTANFSVNNTDGGLTTEEGYLSLVYPNESLTLASVNKIESRSDDSKQPNIKNTTDGKVLTKGGNREQIDGTLTDIWESYQPGETNVYNVTFKRSSETAGEASITYRTAFRPVIETNTDDAQFVRSPTDGQPGPQGWDVKKISGDTSDPDTNWNETYTSDYTTSAHEVISTEDGGYLIAGKTTNYRGDNSDVFVAKVDQNGDQEWQRQVGGSLDDHASTAVQAHDGGYIVAGYKSEKEPGDTGLWIIKFDKGGDKVWRKSYGDSIYDRALDIVATNDGEYAIAGYTETVGNNPRDAWLMKINERGVLKWNETYTSESYDYTEAAALVQTNDGGYALAGQTYDYPDIPDAFVVKTDAQGDVQWKNAYSSEDIGLSSNFREYATDIVQTADGDYTFVGQAYGNRGVIAHLKSNGEAGWQNTWNSYDIDTIESFAKTSDGGYILTQRSSNGKASILRKTDNKGKSEWKKQFKAQSTYDSTGRRIARDVLTTPDGNYVFTGEYKSIDESASAWLTKTSGAAPTNQAPIPGEIIISPSNVTSEEKIKISLPRARDTDGSIEAYKWDLDNDGDIEDTTSKSNITHKFSNAGEYTISVSVTDDDGASATKQRTISVNRPPSAVFKFAPDRPFVNEKVTLDGSYSTDTDGTIESYEWKIDGKNTKIGIKPTLSFETEGKYDVELTVTDDGGAKSTQTDTLVVGTNSDPNADGGENRSASVDDGITLDAWDSSDPDGDSLSYSWNLIAEPESSSINFDDRTGEQQFVQLTHSGEYKFELTVTDEHGKTDTDTVVITAESEKSSTYSVDIQSKNTPVTAGDQINITVAVENTGENEGRQTIELNILSVGNTSKNVHLESGESKDVMLTLDTTKGEEGDYTATVQTESGDTVTTDVEIKASDSEDGEAPDIDWEQVYTDGGDHTETQGMTKTSDGGYVIVGNYIPEEDIYLDKKNRDQEGRVLKLDSNGNVVWNKTYGDSGFDQLNAVARTSDGGYILAGSSWGLQKEEAWVIKIRSDGNVQWQERYGGSADSRALSVVETTDGGYAFAGWKKYTGGDNIPNGWLVKLDSSGSKQWDRTYGGDETDKIQTVIETNSGGFALAGWSDSFASQGDDMWLIRTDKTGNKLWDHTYSNSNDDGAFGEGLIQTNDGGFAVAGFTTDSFDNMWLVKVDESGTKQWGEVYLRSLNDTATSILQTSNGNYVLSGYTETYDGSNDYDGWLLKSDGADGSKIWDRLYGGDSTDAATDVVANTDGSYTLAGYTQSADTYLRSSWVLNTDGGDSDSTVPIINLPDRSTKGLSETTMTATLDQAPNGLSGFTIEVTPKDGTIAEIQSVEEADISVLETELKQDGSAEITATDFPEEIGSGTTDIDLFDIRLSPQQFGTTSFDITVKRMDNTAGEAINPQTSVGTLDIGQGPPPLPDQANAPRDPNGDGVYEDVYGNGRVSFSDAVLLAKNLDSKAVSQHNSQFDFVGNGRVSFADAIELAEIAADGVDRTSSKQSSVQGEQLTPLNNQTENIINRTSGTNSSASGTSIQTNNSTVENKKRYNTTVVSELNKSQQSNRTMRYNGTLRNTSDSNFHIERDQSSTNNTDTSGNSTGAATTNHSNNYQSNSSPDDSIQRSNQSNSTVDITDTGGDGV
jgi:hypothetical protein